MFYIRNTNFEPSLTQSSVISRREVHIEISGYRLKYKFQNNHHSTLRNKMLQNTVSCQISLFKEYFSKIKLWIL